MEFVAVGDTYAKSGKPAELLERYGLTAKNIADSVKSVILRKA
jgi:transketolase